MKEQEKYIPALGFDWLTPLYDPFVKWLMPESKFKKHLIKEANIKTGHRILDVGCGTGTLALLVKQNHEGAKVFGLDGDKKVLEIAQKKAAKAGAEIVLHQGLAFCLPYADKSFDRVFSSLMLHHRTPENKRLSLSEICRVLQPFGELHIADFKKPNKSLAAMLEEIGFEKIEEFAEYKTIFGKVALWSANMPEIII